MIKEKDKQILELNKKFYQSVAYSFSETRQTPWKGWGRVVEIINDVLKNEKIKILDLGCGNGRFLEHIKKSFSNYEYVGIDENEALLKEALGTNKNNKNAKFIKKDIFKEINKIDGKYKLIVGFGITHHIPNEKFREKWFEDVIKLLEKDSKVLLIFTFWEFDKKPGDYLISWDNKPEVARFCHKYSKKETGKIISMYKKHNIKLIEKFESDNKNLYLVFGRI